MESVTLEPSQQRWVDQLVAAFDRHARTRMAGLAVCHPGLHVQAVGWRPWQVEAEPDTSAAPHGVLGVLLTPWFMNLIWRVDDNQHGAGDWLNLPVGSTGTLRLGQQRLSFIGAQEPGVGHFAACSLISPLFQFADQAAAVATAEAVMDTLAQEDAQRRQQHQLALARSAAQAAAAPSQPQRRGFLFGRSAAARTEGA